MNLQEVNNNKFQKMMHCRRNLAEMYPPASLPEVQEEVTIISSNEMQENNTSVPDIQRNTIASQTDVQQKMLSVTTFINGDKAIHYYTGLETYAKFKFVLQSLGPSRFQLKYRYWQVTGISLEDQFLTTLMKLRRNTPNFELGHLFGISSACVSNIFINFMALQWAEVDLRATRELVDFFMPQAFKTSFCTASVIIDATEIPIARPTETELQQATFSEYKHRNTLKVLVGAIPGGLISYCSEAYGGSASDRQIAERSTLRQLVQSGDCILADRGLNVQDLFAHKDVKINIPSFLKGKSQLPNVVLLKDRKIANKRIHI